MIFDLVHSNSNELPSPLSGFQQWLAPPVGWVKINCDASVSLYSLGIGIGCCVCDCNTTLIFAASQFKPVSYSILFAELEAISLSVGVDLGFSRIVIESDAKLAIDLIL